jgi:protocatechuate 3,4-dioxygenase beta subunit
MYFPGDPLQPLDPIFNSIADEAARRRMISRLDMDRSEPNYALAYAWDIVLRGRSETLFEEAGR